MKHRKQENLNPEDEGEVVEGQLVEPEGQTGSNFAPDQSTSVDTADLERLQADLEAAQVKADEYLSGWQRALADFSNYKKRIERDQVSMQQNMVTNLVRRYLDIIDDLERALKNRPEPGEGAAWANGIELIYRKFQAALESEGVTRMEAQGGDFFDPNLHEAISHEPSEEHESGQIIEVVAPGYMIKDRVIRPARVRVAR